MKLFHATIEIALVVHADSESDAMLIAEANALDAARDQGLNADYATEIRSIEQLPPGWTGDCLPYGGNGMDSITSILASLPPVVTRDTGTIDMFEVTQ